jgi:hypothetical protein
MKKLLLATLTLTSLVTTHLASASPLGDEMRAEITAEKLKYKDFLGMTTHPVSPIISVAFCIVNDSRHPAFRHDNSNTKTFKFRKYF